MSTFKIKAKSGVLTARIFENETVGISKGIYYDIVVSLCPIKFKGEVINTSLRMDFILFEGINCLRDIENKGFDYPINPENGYIDSSIYLGGAHNPCDIVKVMFGKMKTNSIECGIAGRVDFTYEGPSELGVMPIALGIDLKFDMGKIDSLRTSL